MRAIGTRLTAAAAVLFVTMLAAEASAQGMVSPFIGSTFGGPSRGGCEAILECEKGSTTFGVGLGALGSIFGFELDLGYTKAFLGETEDGSSGLLTVMGNVIVGPKFGPVQPYVVGGLGMLKLNVDLDLESLLEDSETKLAWDFGGGIMIFFGDNVGVRGDFRYFRTLQDFEFLSVISIEEGLELDFSRATAAVVFKF